jgi:uncharacterized membrane protein YtjA (UPF0391 family)
VYTWVEEKPTLRSSGSLYISLAQLAESLRLSKQIKHSPNQLVMIRWIITFLVIALIAALLGFGGIAAGAAGIAKIIFYIFLVLLAASVLMHLFRRA